MSKVWKIVGGHRRYVGIDAKGRWKFLKTPKGSKSSSKTKKTSKKGGGGKTSKKKSRSMTVPIAPVAGLIAGMTEPIDRAIKGNWTGRDGAIHWLTYNYTGYNTDDGSWSVNGLQKGLVPLMIGLLVHKFIGGSPLNLNRILARHKIPFIRI